MTDDETSSDETSSDAAPSDKKASKDAWRGAPFVVEPVETPRFWRFFQVDDAAAPGADDPARPRDDVWEVAYRGDSVAVLLYVQSVKSVVLQKRFRAGPAARGDAPIDADPRLVETLAAAYDPAKDGAPIDCARACLLERAGYDLDDDMIRRVSTFFASPGASSERIHFFFAVAPTPVYGLEDEEDREQAPFRDREIVTWKASAFLNEIDDARKGGEPIDMKLLLGAQELFRWLRFTDPTAL